MRKYSKYDLWGPMKIIEFFSFGRLKVVLPYPGYEAVLIREPLRGVAQETIQTIGLVKSTTRVVYVKTGVRWYRAEELAPHPVSVMSIVYRVTDPVRMVVMFGDDWLSNMKEEILPHLLSTYLTIERYDMDDSALTQMLMEREIKKHIETKKFPLEVLKVE